MKKSRFTDSQIMAILKEHETGVSVADLARGTCQPQRDTLLKVNSLLALRAAPAAWGNSPDHRSSPQAQGAPD